MRREEEGWKGGCQDDAVGVLDGEVGAVEGGVDGLPQASGGALDGDDERQGLPRRQEPGPLLQSVHIRTSPVHPTRCCR